MLKKAWYILLYHNISWEDGPLTRGLNLTCPPDLFEDHLRHLGEQGDFISIGEGLELLERGDPTGPAFSIWFDDGFRGIRQYALPLLRERKIPAAASFCSRFTEGTETYWRLKLAYLNSMDCLRMLRSRLRPLGFETGQSVRSFCLGHFSPALLAAIDELFNRYAPALVRQDAARLFLSPGELAALEEEPWEIANHTAAHYPVSESSFVAELESQFEECDAKLTAWIGKAARCWVLPFDRPSQRAPGLLEKIRRGGQERWLGLSENKFNRPASLAQQVIYRIPAPLCRGSRLVRHLSRVRAPRNIH